MARVFWPFFIALVLKIFITLILMRKAKTTLCGPRHVDNSVDDVDTQVKSGAKFRQELIDSWSTMQLSSKSLTALAYHHIASGGRGGADLAVNPDSRGDNHSRKVRQTLGLDNVKTIVYHLLVPM